MFGPRLLPWGLLALSLLAAMISPCGAADAVWHDDVDVAWREARQNQRPLLVFITTAGCRYCTMMQNVSFADPAVADLMGGGFVLAAVDADQVDWLVKEENVRSFPTTLVISHKAKVVDRINGYLKPAELKPRLAKTAESQRIASRGRAVKK